MKLITSHLPSKEQSHWQLDILPTVWLLRVNHKIDDSATVEEKKQAKYIVVGIAWLFWSIDFTIYK